MNHYPDLTHDQVHDAIEPLYGIGMEECNGNYQRIVAFKIIQSGKPVTDLTVGEIIAFQAEAKKDHEQLHARYLEAIAFADRLIAKRAAEQGVAA